MGQSSTHRLDLFEDCVEVRKIAGSELGMKCLPIHDDLKCAAARRHQAERFDILFQSQKFLRQTDGFRLVVSNTAILDDDLYAHWQLTFKVRFDFSTDRQDTPDCLPIKFPCIPTHRSTTQ
jgi:hypothetical protein